MKKMTRRQLAAAVSAGVVAAPVIAAPQAAPPQDDLAAARERLRNNAALLSQHPVPMAVEPAFQFKP
jgi:hypothetical protein